MTDTSVADTAEPTDIRPPVAPPATTPAPAAGPSFGNTALGRLIGDPALVGMLDDARASHHELATTELETLQQTQQQRDQVMSTPLERPKVPDLPETPEAPNPQVAASGRRIYGQFLPVLAILGGSLVRRDATAALRTGAAAMRAARANDTQEVELQHQHFTDQLAQITSERQGMLDQYQAAITDTNLDLTQRMAILGALAAKENNAEMRTRVSMGDLTGIMESVQTQMNAVTALRNQAHQDAELNEKVRHDRALETGAGGRGNQLAGADQRGRIVMSLPNVTAALSTITSIQDRLHRNPLGDHAGANVLGSMGGGIVERGMTQDDPDYQTYTQATATLEQSFLPMFAGSATTESEARRYVAANAPQLGDTYARLQEKTLNLQRLANQAAIIIGQPPPYPAAGSLDPRHAAALTPSAPAAGGGGTLGNVPAAALEYLRQHPEAASQFDEQFNLTPGTGQDYLDGQ